MATDADRATGAAPAVLRVSKLAFFISDLGLAVPTATGLEGPSPPASTADRVRISTLPIAGARPFLPEFRVPFDLLRMVNPVMAAEPDWDRMRKLR